MHADCALLLDSDGNVSSCDNNSIFIVMPAAAARDVQFSVPGIEKNRRDSSHDASTATCMDSLRDSMRGMELLDDSAASGLLRAVDVEDIEVRHKSHPCAVHRMHVKHVHLRALSISSSTRARNRI